MCFITKSFLSGNDSQAFKTFKESLLKRDPIVDQPNIKFYWIGESLKLRLITSLAKFFSL
jgi:hypothetical protein